MTTSQRLSIIIPAHNEQARITKTLDAYADYFSIHRQQNTLDFELLVVLNGCSDNTKSVVQEAQQRWENTIRILDLKEAGKGLAIRAGFADALQRPNNLIGFVDADMATRPEYFYELLADIATHDGVIASRYMPGARISPARPWYKRMGSILFYESLVRLFFGLHYHDYQCGAKVFKRKSIEQVVSLLYMRQWAFDVELLYLCKKFGFTVKEVPTTWYDQAGSKLRLHAGARMIGSIIQLRLRHMRRRIRPSNG